jgi:hypothetical protein
VKASALFRSYSGASAVAEASVIAMTAPASQFITYADQTTGVAYANPSAMPAVVTFTAQSANGGTAATTSFTLAPHSHGAANLGPALNISGIGLHYGVAADYQPVAELRGSDQLFVFALRRRRRLRNLRRLALR